MRIPIEAPPERPLAPYEPPQTEVYGPPAAPPVAEPPRPRWVLALTLFVATCVSTLMINGPLYSFAVMLILTAHELGHYFQARRHRMAASLPYFIPLPLPPIGTMGALIVMPSRISNVRALFDMAISGPLAGLVPALAFTVVGLRISEVRSVETISEPTFSLGSPLLFDWLAGWIHGPIPDGFDLFLHPLAFAGWVGIFITALNLIPISQLDGGHILYALLKRRSHPIAVGLLALAIAGTVVGGYWGWSLMILLVLLVGPRHPPTADDRVPLGTARHLLGWATLMFFIIGFTPDPFTVNFPES